MATDGLPILSFAGPRELRAWLAEEHRRSAGLWLKIPKKGSGLAGPSYAEALEHALCFGWIDSQKRSFDETCFLQRFTPRGPRSRWSKINRAKAEALIAAGRMKPAGLAEVEAAKADGRWEAAYDSPRNAKVPDDLAAALAANPSAGAFFATLSSARRFAILYRIHDAKRADTRARRIATFVAMCARGETVR